MPWSHLLPHQNQVERSTSARDEIYPEEIRFVLRTAGSLLPYLSHLNDFETIVPLVFRIPSIKHSNLFFSPSFHMLSLLPSGVGQRRSADIQLNRYRVRCRHHVLLVQQIQQPDYRRYDGRVDH